MQRISQLVAVLSVFVLATGPAASEDGDVAEYIRAHYTKFEYRIAMRDGVELFTLAFVPNDASDQRTYPMLLARSPYSVGPYGVDRYPKSFFLPEDMVREGFIFVMQDVRGRFLSEGQFVNMRPHREDKKGSKDIDESTDTYDTVEWLVSHIKHNNGKVGIWGNSYLGFYTSAGIIDTHPAIKAAMPSAPIADWYFDDMHHHGALSLNMTFNFFSMFGVVREGLTTEWPERFDHETPDGYQFFLDLGPLSNVNERYFHHEIPFWDAVVTHPDYDEFWKARDILPRILEGAGHPATPEARQLCRADGRWSLRCRGSVRRVAHLREHRGIQPGHRKHHRHGPLVSRRVAPQRRTEAGWGRLRLCHRQ